MGRSSDTRTLTRTAAAKLVSAGHRPHAVTVDLIYAEIKQGSRTTINDELKLWKDEQAKVNALSAAVPESVASSMLALWAVAVEQGEKAFAEKREALESALEAANALAQAAEAALADDRARLEQLLAELQRSQERESIHRAEIESLRTAKDEALQRAAGAERETITVRAAAQAREATLSAELDQKLAAARAELAAKEASLRVELRESTERLEGVQKHVMLQVSDARELQRRAEDQAARANQRGDKLATDLESLRGQLAEILPAHERALASLAEASGEVSGLRTERDGLKETLARTTGQLDAATTQFTVLTARIADRQMPGSGARKKRQAPQIARKT